MGEAAFVNRIYLWAGSQPRTMSARPDLGLDFILISVIAALILFGLLMVYSASPLAAARLNAEPADYFLKRQILWAALAWSHAVFAGLLQLPLVQTLDLC